MNGFSIFRASETIPHAEKDLVEPRAGFSQDILDIRLEGILFMLDLLGSNFSFAAIVIFALVFAMPVSLITAKKISETFGFVARRPP